MSAIIISSTQRDTESDNGRLRPLRFSLSCKAKFLRSYPYFYIMYLQKNSSLISSEKLPDVMTETKLPPCLRQSSPNCPNIFPARKGKVLLRCWSCRTREKPCEIVLTKRRDTPPPPRSRRKDPNSSDGVTDKSFRLFGEADFWL